MPISKIIVSALFLFNIALPCCFAQSKNDPTRKQVKWIFPGTRLAKDYKFNFNCRFQEVIIRTNDSIDLDGILFKAGSPKGVILYLHGNTGAIDKWGAVAGTYTNLNYDLLMLDYRGYGKSGGEILNEDQLDSDVQDAYDHLKLTCPEDKIVVVGYSIGTGPAAALAANNHPKKLILQAPYYSLPDAIHHLRPSFDTTRLAFKFNIYQFLPKTSAGIFIFHGDADQMFYYGSSEKLKSFFKPGDELITLHGAGHFDMDKNKEYLAALKRILQ